MDIERLNSFIVKARVAALARIATVARSSEAGTFHLVWREGEWCYVDSSSEETPLVGRQTVSFHRELIWMMNYYGSVRHPELVDPELLEETVIPALADMYSQHRFLGGFERSCPRGRCVDRSDGNATGFHGRTVIIVDGMEAVVSCYFGGLITETTSLAELEWERPAIVH